MLATSSINLNLSACINRSTDSSSSQSFSYHIHYRHQYQSPPITSFHVIDSVAALQATILNNHLNYHKPTLSRRSFSVKLLPAIPVHNPVRKIDIITTQTAARSYACLQ